MEEIKWNQILSLIQNAFQTPRFFCSCWVALANWPEADPAGGALYGPVCSLLEPLNFHKNMLFYFSLLTSLPWLVFISLVTTSQSIVWFHHNIVFASIYLHNFPKMPQQGAPEWPDHTSYLSFLLHKQDFRKPNFTPKKTTKKILVEKFFWSKKIF